MSHNDGLSEEDCVVGHFYWISPVYCPDKEESFDEQVAYEPAKYLGDMKWSLLGTEDETEWPVRFIHSEIIPPNNDGWEG